jgi:mycoredoxin
MTELYTPTVEPGSVVMYTTTWCGYCKNLKRQMQGAGVSFSEVNIEEVAWAADFVMSVNGGNQTVPTVLVVAASGKESTLTNPSLAQVSQALSA